MNVRPILLVEDNADDAELARRAFRKNDVAQEIVVREDGPAALEYLRDERSPLPSLVLLDLQIPKISGLDVLRAIRENDRTRLLPVIILSNSREPNDVVQSYSLGANSYIVKPIEFDAFVKAVRLIGTYWLSLNEPAPAGVGRGTEMEAGRG